MIRTSFEPPAEGVRYAKTREIGHCRAHQGELLCVKPEQTCSCSRRNDANLEDLEEQFPERLNTHGDILLQNIVK
jgi:hypothetical protein